MKSDDRLGTKDATAAALFSAARAYQPSARSRRRTLRALGLPVGLSLFGAAMAHAAQALSGGVKGWVLVVGAVATVGTGGGVVYLVTAEPAAAPMVVEASAVPARPRPMAARTTTDPAIAVPAAVAPPIYTVPPILVSRPAPRPPASRVVGAPPRAPAPLPAMDPPPEPPPPQPLAPGRIEMIRMTTAPAPAMATPAAPLPLPSPTPAVQTRPLVVPAAPIAAPAPSPLQAELALIVAADARLRALDPGGALRLLDQHTRLFPAGAMAEEAEVLRISALAAAGDRQQAQARAERFLQQRPRSPLAPRVRASIGFRALDSNKGDVR